MKIVKNKIAKEELEDLAREYFGDMVKAVVDVEKEIMVIGGELHADGEVLLMEKEGSRREHTWGINLYPAKRGKNFIEFDSMINLKPMYGNRSRGVENVKIQKKIEKIVKKLVSP